MLGFGKMFAILQRACCVSAIGIGVLFFLPSYGACANTQDMIGADACFDCHDGYEEHFSETLHGRALSESSPYYVNRCEYCHGAGEAHEEDPTDENIITFGEESDTPEKLRSRQCLTCHGGDAPIALWQTGMHGKSNLSCDTCHMVHSSPDGADNTPESCYECHADIRADLHKQSRHPIREGKVECVSCHNPHGTLTDHLIAADDTNDLCYKCHAEKRGPFMWEHSPVEEDCGTCHTPHGSRHKKLLVQRTPSLCQNCHISGHTSSRARDSEAGFTGSSPSNRYYGRNCLTCHPNIHGSQAPNSRGKRLIY